MDQIYIPKNRAGFAIGNYVVIKQLEERQENPAEKLYFYGVKELEPVKLKIIHQVLELINKSISNYENIFITGSFLEKGFNFNDIDFLIIIKNKINHELIRRDIEKETGINAHIITLSSKELSRGLETDPLYQMMLSRCIAKKRFILKIKNKIDYKILDLHLLKSKTLINNFDMLSGKEKYDLARNLIVIYLYLKRNKINTDFGNKKIKEALGLSIQEIKDNIIDKKEFLKRYKLIYNKSFATILKGIEHGSKQE